MRSYIFTKYERALVAKLLAGERNDAIWKLQHRLRTFSQLASDVDLYMKASEATPTKK